MATHAAAPGIRPEVMPSSPKPAHFREGHSKNVSDWLEKNSGSKDNLPPIGLPLLRLSVEA